jgi:imidazoleglycerol-phosphate dehydratase
MKSNVNSKRPGKRIGAVERITTETQIRARLALDGHGKYSVHTGVRFLDHMLELFTKHGGFDLKLRAAGDLDIDQHHTVEDVGIVLGDCFRQALGDKRGINRAGYFIMPLDETLAVAAVDLSGRPYLVCDAKFKQPIVGDLQTELVEDFFYGFATHAGANVHLKLLYGRSTHHAVEALFKTFARAMKMAVSRDARMKREMPSTKGLL